VKDLLYLWELWPLHATQKLSIGFPMDVKAPCWSVSAGDEVIVSAVTVGERAGIAISNTVTFGKKIFAGAEIKEANDVRLKDGIVNFPLELSTAVAPQGIFLEQAPHFRDGGSNGKGKWKDKDAKQDNSSSSRGQGKGSKK
jgi:hypothetical protein